MSLSDTRRKLIDAAARLGAHERAVSSAEKKLVGRAREQRDTLPAAHDIVAEYVGAGRGGGVLGHRQLRTLQTERKRLDDILDGSE